MRRLASIAALIAILLPVSACSGGEPAAMPEVMGKSLDIALSDIERAGFDDEVEVLGGGMFGVVDESNWTVCSQEPVSGSDLTAAPRLSVARTCDDEDANDPAASPDAQGLSEKEKAAKRKERKQASNMADTFTMPGLVGSNLQDAQDKLQAHGSYLLTQTDGTGLHRFQMLDYNWKVCAQSPSPGTVTDIATFVELVAVKLSEAC